MAVIAECLHFALLFVSFLLLSNWANLVSLDTQVQKRWVKTIFTNYQLLIKAAVIDNKYSMET